MLDNAGVCVSEQAGVCGYAGSPRVGKSSMDVVSLHPGGPLSDPEVRMGITDELGFGKGEPQRSGS